MNNKTAVAVLFPIFCVVWLGVLAWQTYHSESPKNDSQPSIVMDIESFDATVDEFVVGRTMIGSNSFYIIYVPSGIGNKKHELIDVSSVLLIESNDTNPTYMRCTTTDGCKFEMDYMRKLIVPVGHTEVWYESDVVLSVME